LKLEMAILHGKVSTAFSFSHLKFTSKKTAPGSSFCFVDTCERHARYHDCGGILRSWR
jgi:hypothetical protein